MHDYYVMLVQKCIYDIQIHVSDLLVFETKNENKRDLCVFDKFEMGKDAYVKTHILFGHDF